MPRVRISSVCDTGKSTFAAAFVQRLGMYYEAADALRTADPEEFYAEIHIQSYDAWNFIYISESEPHYSHNVIWRGVCVQVALLASATQTIAERVALQGQLLVYGDVYLLLTCALNAKTGVLFVRMLLTVDKRWRQLDRCDATRAGSQLRSFEDPRLIKRHSRRQIRTCTLPIIAVDKHNSEALLELALELTSWRLRGVAAVSQCDMVRW